jgi:hypothetical protein
VNQVDELASLLRKIPCQGEQNFSACFQFFP